MGTRRALASACMLIEVAAVVYMVYLLLFTPALAYFPRGIGQFDFVFMWLFPGLEVMLGYFDLARGCVDSGRRKLAWGAAIATFGCVLLIIMGGGLTFPVRGELMRVVPVHVLLPLVAFLLTRSLAGASGGSGSNVSMPPLGRVVINVVLSAGMMGLGIMLTALLIKSDIFSNSVIFIGIVPIPGMVMVATPIIPAILGVIYIWEHNK